MITHLVFFKLPERTPEGVKKLVDLLSNMEGKVESLRFIEVGADVRGTERSFDVALTTKFDNWADLDSYATHPVHQLVLKHVAECGIKTVAVDYES